MSNTSSTPDQQNLSDYEKIRLEKINRNEQRLKDLGLDKGFSKPLTTKQKNKGKRASLPSFVSLEPPRRSVRKRKTLDYKENASASAGVDSDYDETASDDGSADDDDLEEIVHVTPRKRTRATNQGSEKPAKDTSIVPPSSTGTAATATTGGLVCELAKTGRSTCRKCSNKIEKGAPRVGMQAWIVGRQAITWQCAVCFLGNITCGYDVSGRSRCKATNELFIKGELRVGARSHTATSFFKIDAVGIVLDYVASWVQHKKQLGDILQINRIEGNEVLTQDDRNRLQILLTSISCNLQDDPLSMPTAQVKHVHVETKEKSPRTTDMPTSSQPSLGVKSGAKGRVQWKFGGHICLGSLLPSKETHTHCYARTHKGNVKTLAKGKDYWSVLG